MEKRITKQIKNVLSLANKEIKLLKSLQLKKHRVKNSLFLAEGLKICAQAVNSGYHPKNIVFSEKYDLSDSVNNNILKKVIDDCFKNGGKVFKVSNKVLEKVSGKKNPQTVLGTFKPKLSKIMHIMDKKNAFWLALDRIRDPGNLGTIIRTVDAVNGNGVILIGDCTDPFSLESVRASMGSIFNISIVKTSTFQFKEYLKCRDIYLIGTFLDAKKDYKRANWKKSSILLLGNEKEGISEELKNICSEKIIIPMKGDADSLNISISAGILLYEKIRSK